MKFILSRKGFDSSNGGIASPILPDGTMLSLPIPVSGVSEEEGKKEYSYRYSDFEYNYNGHKLKYDEIISLLQGRTRRGFPYSFCHPDPALRADMFSQKDGWTAAYGQCNGSQTHLINQGVEEGDIFLFFGMFRETEDNDESVISFKRRSPAVHALYGYLQIGEILTGDDIKNRVPYHPHASDEHLGIYNNTVYLPSEELIIDGKGTGLKGYGTFKYDQELVLSHSDKTRSKWKLFDWMHVATISQHTRHHIHKDEEYFQSRTIGQEFVVSGSKEALKWATAIILNHAER